MRFFGVQRTLAKTHDTELAAALADATPDADLIRELTVDAISTRIRTFSCPLTVLQFDYSQVDRTHAARVKSSSVVNRFESADLGAKDDIRKEMFIQYAKAYKHVSKVACFRTSGPKAHHAVRRLAQHFKLGTTVDDVTMDALNSILAVSASFCDISSNKTMPAADRVDKLLLQPTGMYYSGGSTATLPGAGSTVSSNNSISNEVTLAQRQFMQSLPVVTLENDIRSKLMVAAPDIPDHRYAITKVLRAKLSLTSQLVLGTRSSVPGGEIWDRVKAGASHLPEVLAFAITAEEDSNNILVQPDRLKTFGARLSIKTVKELVQLHFNSSEASLHALAHKVRNMTTEGAKDRTPHSSIRYGSVHANEAYVMYADRICYFVGFDNGVYSSFLKPIHKLLLSAPDANDDDFLDVQEACTDAVTLGHKEMARHFAVFTSAGSPSVPLPFNGTMLVADDGEFKARCDEIKFDMADPNSKLFKRRRQKLKDVDALPKKLLQLDAMLRQGAMSVSLGASRTVRTWRKSP